MDTNVEDIVAKLRANLQAKAPPAQTLQEWHAAGGGIPTQYRDKPHEWHAKVKQLTGKQEPHMGVGGFLEKAASAASKAMTASKAPLNAARESMLAAELMSKPTQAEAIVKSAPTIIIPSKLTNVKDAVRKNMGEYGARRVERAADEVPNLERMYTEDALRQAFSGDNAKAMMTMNPKDFEKYAVPLDPRLMDANSTRYTSSGNIDKYNVPTDEYIQHLKRVRGGFEDVPFLNLFKDEVGLPTTPSVKGHEGRHRSRALADMGEDSSLVQVIPSGDLREGMPRRSQEEYIQALIEELDRSNRLVLPEKYFDNISQKNINRPRIELPEVYAHGGEVHMKDGGFREQDTVSATPRNAPLGFIADVFQGAQDALSNPNRKPRLMESIMSSLLGVEPIARTADRLSYGEPLTSGSGQTLRPLDDTTDAFLTVAPLAGPLARAGGKGAKTTAKFLAPKAGAMLDEYAAKTGLILPVMKPKGGNWLDGQSERITEPLKLLEAPRYTHVNDQGFSVAPEYGRPMTAEELAVSSDDPHFARNKIFNTWIDKKLNPYVRNEMGTPEDPLRLMAEQYAIDKPELLAQADAKLAKLNAKTQELMQERGVPAEYLTRHRQDIIAAEKARDLIEARQALHTQVPEGGRWEPEHLAGKRVGAGFPAKGMGVSEEAKNWEQIADEAIGMQPAGDRIGRGYVTETTGINTWLNKVPPETPTYTGYGTNGLNFEHLGDELRNALDPESGLPINLRLNYDELPKKTVPDIVNRVADINAWRATQKAEADLALANNAASVLVKEYPQQGLAWKEIKLPQPVLKEGYSVVRDEPTYSNWSVIPHPEGGGYALRAENGQMALESNGRVERKWNSPKEAQESSLDYAEIQEPDIDELFKVVDPSGKTVSVGATKNEALNLLDREERHKALEDALKYEGDILQHCVGGYCPDVAQGKSLIYSLRDTQGKSHATIEVKPVRHPIGTSAKGNNFPYEITYGEYADPPVKIPEETKQKIYNLGKQLHEQNGGSPNDNFEIAANQILGPFGKEIKQIKGLRNQAPAKKYQAQLQDFIKSDNWSDVSDLENAGLYKLDKDFLGDAVKKIPTGETSGMFLSGEQQELILKAMKAKLLPERGYITKEEYENALKAVAPDEGMARGGLARMQLQKGIR